MGLIKDILGSFKDKASLTKATFTFSSPTTLTILKATTHEPTLNDNHLTTLLSIGNGTRTTASLIIQALMHRLHHTTSSIVALKCLLSLHIIIRHGSFILHDQLSIYPSYGGRNYLKLSDFKDTSSSIAWEISRWVRWYAKYIEQILSVCRVLGHFVYGDLDCLESEKGKEIVGSLLNDELLREIESLIMVSEEVSRIPELLNLRGNRLIDRVLGLVEQDLGTTIDETMVRLVEFRQRLSCLSFSESVELVRALRRLGDCCKEMGIFSFQGRSGKEEKGMEVLWELVGELKLLVGMARSDEGSSRAAVVNTGRLGGGSESARFGEQSFKRYDSVKFSSNRFCVASALDTRTELVSS